MRTYHAHVYFDDATRQEASKIREKIRGFHVPVGRMHDQPVGPHPKRMFQIALDSSSFGKVVDYLMMNRRGLSVLVHPLTGDDLADHVQYSFWLGEKLDLNLEKL